MSAVWVSPSMMLTAGPSLNAHLWYESFTASDNSALLCMYSSNCSQNYHNCWMCPSNVGTLIFGKHIPSLIGMVGASIAEESKLLMFTPVIRRVLEICDLWESTIVLLCRDASGSKWPAVLKLWGQLLENHSKMSQNTYKNLWYTIAKNAPRILLPHSEAEKSKFEIFEFVNLLSSSSSRVTQKP